MDIERQVVLDSLEQGFLTFSRPFTPWPCEKSPFTPNQLLEGHRKCKMSLPIDINYLKTIYN